MITKIEVDGFKSLAEFQFQLNQGLNILVGPNGAGKTNIILFFEFLSNIATSELATAISNVGGAGAIFQKNGADKLKDSIRCKVYGCVQETKTKFFVYEYSFEIKLSLESDSVYYTTQQIKMRSASRFWKSPDENRYLQDWDFDFRYELLEHEKPVAKLNRLNKKKFGSSLYETRIKTEKVVLNRGPARNTLIHCLFPGYTHLFFIHNDLKGGETFNIIPSKVKELEDSATPPGINKDGSGLSTTLYAMKKRKGRLEFPNNLFDYYSSSEIQKAYRPETLQQITSFLKVANTSIESLDVDNDPFNNKLVTKIKISSGDYKCQLPLAAMSDGTIKWLTLITAILTSKTIFSIEEPENFLHPWMQAEIVQIMRDHLNKKKRQSFVLMTTHSESLLNQAEPHEIILVDLIYGKTRTKRISNQNAIKEQIADSGFGLGHFYFSNSLVDE